MRKNSEKNQKHFGNLTKGLFYILKYFSYLKESFMNNWMA